MKVAISGHQRRKGLRWSWVRHAVGYELDRVGDVTLAISSLAEGADQVFAQCALKRGIPLRAVIPMQGYERYFEGRGLAQYRLLLARSEVERLDAPDGADEAFLRAGRRVVDEADLLVAVWDGRPADGKGGTADVVAYARQVGVPVVHLNPLTERTLR